MGVVFAAWGDEDWTLDGAAVRVSLVCFDGAGKGTPILDGQPAHRVLSDLTNGSSTFDLTKARPLHDNLGLIFQGMKFVGDFDIAVQQAREWLLAPFEPQR